MKYIAMILIVCAYLSLVFVKTNNKTFAQNSTPIYFELQLKEKKISFDSHSICNDKTLLNKWGRNNGHSELFKNANIIMNKMGFSAQTTVEFLFPGLKKIYEAISKKINTPSKDANILFTPNTGDFKIENEVVGEEFLIEETSNLIIQELEKSNYIKLKIITQTIDPLKNKTTLENYTKKKSNFSTYCSNSSQSRKNNIKKAINSINGYRIEPNGQFSFNNATGPRSIENGYELSNIILNGMFTQGAGGGVCQVSSTLYNAALLAGLEIVEHHQHSLPISYVPPSRDAMVSENLADLIIKNNTNGPVFIRARFLNNNEINIQFYGEKNKYKYSLESKITKKIKSSKEKIIKNETPLLEKKRICYPKDGYTSEAYLIAKDENDKIVSTKHLRSDYYAPIDGIIIM